jgi:Na+/melibiose symporter-like transporter
VTETPPLAPEVVSPNMAVAESSNTQLYLVLGAVLGGLLLLVILFLIIFICNRQRNNNQSSQSEFVVIKNTVSVILSIQQFIYHLVPLFFTATCFGNT